LNPAPSYLWATSGPAGRPNSPAPYEAPSGTALMISTPPAIATSYWPETSPAAA
jgi:hypothetical protein